MRNTVLVFLFFFIPFLVLAQSNEIEKEMYRYHKTKTLKWANKQDPNKVEILFIDDYDQSDFPSSDILKFKNLKHLIVNGRSLARANSKEIKDPVVLDIDATALLSLGKLEYLQLSKFDFRTFPKELTKLENLTALGLNNCIIEAVPAEISNMKNLKGLFLRQNRISDLPSELKALEQLEIVDLCNNKLTSIPKVLKELTNLESIYLANYNGVKSDAYTWDWPVILEVNYMDYVNNIGQLNELLRLPNLENLHLHVNSSGIKKNVKGLIHNIVAAKKIVWQAVDCGCG